jgi:hypothetical protein
MLTMMKQCAALVMTEQNSEAVLLLSVPRNSFKTGSVGVGGYNKIQVTRNKIACQHHGAFHQTCGTDVLPNCIMAC